MKKIKTLNLMENNKMIFWINIATIPLWLVFSLLFFYLTIVSVDDSTISFTDVSWLWIAICLVVIIMVHELIHGLFFKLFNPEGKVKFGFKKGMAYATSPNSFYTKGQFTVILLSPFVVITLVLYLGLLVGVVPPAVFVALSAVHGGCCIGDFFMGLLLVKEPKDVLVEDTEQGFNLYKQEVESS